MRIGEVSRRSGVSVRMLRHYDSLGLVSPSSRTAAGYREYADADLRRILQVEALRSLGMSLAEAAEALAGTDPHAPSDILESLLARTRARITAEQELLTRLEHTRARSPDDWEDVLDTVALLRAVRSDDPRTRHDAALVPDTLPAAAFAEAALTEDEPNVAGALRWAADHATGNPTAVLAAAADALRTHDAARRLRAVHLLGDQFRQAAAVDDVSTDHVDEDPDDHLANGPADRLANGPADDQRDHRAAATAREAAALLVSALTDEDTEVRAHAALTLASRPRGRMTGDEEDTADAEQAGDALDTAGAEEAADAEDTAGAATRTDDPAVKSQFADSQVADFQAADSHLRDLLVHMIVDGTKDVEAAEALAHLTGGGERAADAAAASAAVEAIRDRLEDRTTPAAGRVRLVQALGELPASTVAPVLAVLTGDGDPHVARVATYLARRGEQGSP